MYLDLCMMIFVSTDFYRAILNASNRSVNGSGVNGSKEGTSSPPIIFQVQSEFQYLPPGHQTLCVLPSKARRASFPVYVGAPSKEPAL